MTALYLQMTAALVLTAVAVVLAKWTRFVRADAAGRRRAVVVAGGVFVAALVPVPELSAARLILSLSPSLSVVTLAFCLHAIASGLVGRGLFQRAELPLLGGGVLLVSLPLFASVLGLWPLDLYVLGYHFSWVYFVPAGWGVWAAWQRRYATALVMLAALVAHAAQLLPSRNLWDTLADGLAFVVALALVARAGVGWLASRRRDWHKVPVVISRKGSSHG